MGCFLLMQWYTQLLLYLFVPLLIRRLWLEPFLWKDWWAALKVVAFVAGWVQLRRLVRHFLSSILAMMSNGWPSMVLLTKFQVVADYAAWVEKQACNRMIARGSTTPSPSMGKL